MEDEKKEITEEQNMNAQRYVAGFFKMMGMRYPYDMPEEGEPIPDGWPKDVKAAVETMQAYSQQLKDLDIKV